MMDPGVYEMHIIFYADTGAKTPYAIPGSPFSVRVGTGSGAGAGAGYTNNTIQHNEYDTAKDMFIDAMPLCDSGYTSSQTPGRWIRANIEDQNCGLATRGGWKWAPFSCHFQMFPIWKMSSIKKPLWITVMGTSTTRGIFFEFLDFLLTEEQMQILDIEKWWKCWGYLDFRINNFRVSFRDFRFKYTDSQLSKGYRGLGIKWLHQNVCPYLHTGESEDDWANTTAQGFSDVPDIIVAESPEILRIQSPGCIEDFERRGGLFIGISLKPRDSSLVLHQSEADNPSQIFEHNHRPFLDIFPMARPMYNNDRSEFNGIDIHYVHTGSCHTQKLAIGTHVCSEVLEMEVFMVLHVIAQNQPSLFNFSEKNNNVEYRYREPKPFTICRQCPTSFGFLDNTQPLHCTKVNRLSD